jgi:hypothetical protein
VTNPAIFVSQRINGDSVCSQELPAGVITGHPYLNDVSAVGIFNGSTSHALRIKHLSCRAISAEQNQSARCELVRITAASGGSLVTPFKVDSANSSLPSQVEVREMPTSATVVSGSVLRSIMMIPWANYTRPLGTWIARTNGDSNSKNDSSEIAAHGRGVDTQGYRINEGEGLLWRLATTTQVHCYTVSILMRDVATGATHLINQLAMPDGGSANILSILNGSGSGVVLSITRIQIREIGTDETAVVDYCLLDGLDPNAADAGYVYDGSLPAGVLVKRDALGARAGAKWGAVIAMPKPRVLGLTEPPYGVAVAGGPQVVRRGKLSHDYIATTEVGIVLRPGMGIGACLRNASAMLNHEFNATLEVEEVGGGGGGTFPAAGDVRDGEVYGPTDNLVGTLELPTAGDVRLGTGYGADGTEFTGTLDPGGGGGTGTLYLRRR